MPWTIRWSRWLSMVGGLAVLVGALDPLEGSALILPGSGLLALGSYIGREEQRTQTYKLWGFILVAIGVAVIFGITALGGIAGTSGHSVWWALLILPYVIGWWIDVWGPGSPKWHMIAGILIGGWYLVILIKMLYRPAANPISMVPAYAVGIIGFVTIAACAVRLHRNSRR